MDEPTGRFAGRGSRRTPVLALVIVAAVVAVAVLLSSCQSVSEDEREAAVKALEAVEACHDAVTAGVTLDDLRGLSATAQREVRALERSTDNKVLDPLIGNLNAAADAYAKSCSAWMDSNDEAMAKYEEAMDARELGDDFPDIEDFQDDSEYQDLWSYAEEKLQFAQSDFEAIDR